MKILIYPDKMLSMVAKVVEDIDDSLQNLIDNMMKTMADNSGLGLAAPQVGELKRLFIYEHQNTPLVLINPAVEKIDDSLNTQEEACLSILKFQARVVRASKIKVYGLDREGTEQKFEASGMLARIIQHEADHLDGKLFIDRIDPLKRLNYNRDLQKIMREGR